MASTRARIELGAAGLVLAGLVLAGAACGSRTAPTVAAPPSNTPATGTAPAAPVGFAAVAAERGFVFEMPDGFVEVPVVENRDVRYDHAIQRADGTVELRFALREYGDDAPPVARTAQFSWTFFVTAIMNITRGGGFGEADEPEPVPPAMYDADDATLVRVRWPSTDGGAGHFGRGFARGNVFYLHREDFGDAYVFILHRDPDAKANLGKGPLRALRFAPRD